MKVRSLVLLQAGFAVREAISASDAIKVFMAGDFDLVLICHTILEPDRIRLIAAVRLFSPSAKIISIRMNGEASAKLADNSLHSLDGPEALIQTVKETIAA